MGSIINTAGNTGSMTAGGLVGMIDSYKNSNYVTIQNSFSVMKLTGRQKSGGHPLERLGGLIGYAGTEVHSTRYDVYINVYNAYARGSLNYSSNVGAARYGGLMAFHARAGAALEVELAVFTLRMFI